MAEEDTEETETSKQLEGDVAEAMAAFFDEHGGTVSTMTIADFVEWATGEDLDDLPDVVEVEGVEIPIRPEEEPEADEEDMEEDGMDDDMEDTQMSDNEEESKDEAGEATDGEAQAQESQPEWAAEMHDSIKSVGNTVDDVKTRVADLEKEVFEEAGEAAEDASAEIGVDEAAEKALAKMAEEISGDDLDEDDDPADIVRKNLHEVDDSPSGGAVDEWSADEIEAGYGGGD